MSRRQSKDLHRCCRLFEREGKEKPWYKYPNFLWTIWTAKRYLHEQAAKCQIDCLEEKQEKRSIAMVQVTKQNNPCTVGVIGWTRMGLVGSTNWLENLLFIFNRHSYKISTHEDKHYSNHTMFIRTSNCTANTCTTSTTVCHHTHLGLKVDNRFESGEDLNNVWMTMVDSYHQSSNIILEEERNMDTLLLIRHQLHQDDDHFVDYVTLCMNGPGTYWPCSW